MAMWHSFVSSFSREYRIVLFDFPGLGKAPVLKGPSSLSLDEQIRILDGVMQAAQLNSNTIFCTASWGGVIALAYAAKHPKAIKRLVLGSIGTKPNKKMIETIKKGLSIDTKNRLEMADVLIESFGQKLPLKIKNKISKQFSNMSEEALLSFSQHGTSGLSAKNLTELVDLNSIETETLILRGEHDAIIDLDDVYFLSSKIPNSKVKVIKDIGHFMHLETEGIFDVYRDALAGRCFES
jgi:pimeloyl-ACP methyl ester carboxylesterase